MKPTWFERALISVSPETAMRRARARHVARAYYDAGKPTKHHRPRGNGRQSQNTAVAQSAEYIREQARYLESNYELAEATLAVFQKFVVGQEVLFEPQIRDMKGDLHKEANDEVSYWIRKWMEAPEVTGEYDYHEGARQHIRSRMRDGEMFQQYVEGFVPGLQHGCQIPLSIEHIQSDFLPLNFTDPTRRIRQSIETSAWGRPLKYWLHKQDPNDMTLGNMAANMAQPEKYILARNMVHDKHTKHFRQLRGVSVFANVLHRFDAIKDIEESERVAARCAAAMVGFRTRGTVDDWEPAEDEAEREEMSFTPGMWMDLEPGEGAEVYQSSRPNNALIPFMEEQAKRIAGGTGVSYSSITCDYSGTFSSQRQELVENYVGYGVVHADLCNAKLLPDYRRVVASLVKYKLWKPPQDVDLRTITDVDIPRPPMVWIDPKKEADAFNILVQNDLESREHVFRSRGRDPRKVTAQIEADPFRARALSTNEPGLIGAKEDDEDKNDTDDE